MNIRMLLVIPPLDMPTNPYPAVPQLSAYLKMRGHHVDTLDLNIEFHHWLASRTDESIRSAREVLQALSHKKAHTDAAVQRTLQYALSRIDKNPEKFRAAVDTTNPGGMGARLEAFNCLMAVSFASWLPETVHLVPMFSSLVSIYTGRGDAYSSNSLLGALEHPSLFSLFFEDFLPGFFKSRQWDIVGISVPFASNAEPALRIARWVRRNSTAHIVLGGSYAGLNLARTKRHEFFAYFHSIAVGMGERTLEALIENGADCKAVQGLVWSDGEKIVQNGPGCDVPLEELPLPDSSGRERYVRTESDHFVRIRLSQGCQWKRCAFCNLVGCGIFPNKRPDEEHMFAKVEELIGRGERTLYFGDDEADADMLYRFSARIIERGLRFYWTINTRFSEKITLPWAMQLRQAGCRSLAFGLETFSDRLLTFINKGTSAAMINECLHNLAWGGVPVLAYMMVGLPTETEDEARASFGCLMEHMRDGRVQNVIYNLYHVASDSPIHKFPSRYGITRLLPNDEQDLWSNMRDFEHSGMQRDCAENLLNEFNAEILKLKAL